MSKLTHIGDNTCATLYYLQWFKYIRLHGHKIPELFIGRTSDFSKRKKQKKGKDECEAKATWSKEAECGVPEADLHGHPLPTEVRTCRRHCSRIFAFSPPLGAGIQVYPPAGTGRTPLRLLRIVCGRAPGSFSCMLDILLHTSFLDDMGDHSKSKLSIILLFWGFFFLFFLMNSGRWVLFWSCFIHYSCHYIICLASLKLGIISKVFPIHF